MRVGVQTSDTPLIQLKGGIIAIGYLKKKKKRIEIRQATIDWS
jgi:hypothetical protein